MSLRKRLSRPQNELPPQSSEGRTQIQAVLNVLLIIGIVFLPFIFAWFTLRKGHSKLARIVSFTWMALSLILMAFEDKEDTDEAEVQVASAQNSVETQEISKSDQNNERTTSDNLVSQPQYNMPSQPLQATNRIPADGTRQAPVASSPYPVLTAGTACRYAIGTSMMRNPNGISIESEDGLQSVVSYIKEDGSYHKYECDIQSDGRVIWRMFSSGDPGRWRNHPADEILRYYYNRGILHVAVIYSDGSQTTQSYDFTR